MKKNKQKHGRLTRAVDVRSGEFRTNACERLDCEPQTIIIIIYRCR